MNSYLDSYPYLESLIGGWFHQDYDLSGETLEEIIGAYRANSPPEDHAGVKADIQRFLRFAGNDVDAEFVRRFEPGVLPSAWGLNARDYLLRIAELL